MSDLYSSILRVLNGEKVIGAAFLVSTRLAITCAHVVEAAGKKKGEKVKLRFDSGIEITAMALEEYWRGKVGEDVAILKLDRDIEGVPSLVLSPSQNTKGHKFSTYGFPKPTQELPGGGEIIDSAIVDNVRLLQLRSQEVTPGFSGAPIIDESNQYLKRVIGMVVSITPPDKYGRLGATAFAIPSETLCQICPEISIEATFDAMAEEFLALPNMDLIDISLVRNVYSLCFDGITLLQPLASSRAGLREMVLHLSQATSLDDSRARPLAYFATTLADRLSPSQKKLAKTIHIWLNKHATMLMVNLTSINELIRIDPVKVNPPCLQIILKPYIDQPNANPHNQYFILKGRDARNDRLLCSDKMEFSKLAPYIRKNVLYKIFDTLRPDEAENFENLWIEFCLHTSDLSRKVEQWVADEETNQTFGQTFNVVVRSIYRWDNRIELRKNWPNKWNACKAAISNRLNILNFEVVSKEPLSSFEKAVMDAQVVGLPFELRDDESNGNLLTMLLDSGVPVAIWIRRGIDVELAEQWLQKNITGDLNLLHLAEQVRVERQSGSALGKSLVLLWDNYDHKLGEEESFQTPALSDEISPW